MRFGRGPLADQRKLVRGGRPKSGPDSNRGEARERRHELDPAPNHLFEDVRIRSWIPADELSRGADEKLARRARLNIESDRGGPRGQHVGALQVAELHQLMPAEAGIAVGDDEMS